MNSRYFAASYSGSAHRAEHCPAAVAEVAFAGRSNAGKSSVINTITRNGKLARIGKTPGRTQMINHFELADGRYLVDLPGYGYARVSKSRQSAWQHHLREYLLSRDELRGLVMVMDVRHPLTEHDWTLIELQQAGAADLHVILTKCDKLSRSAALRQLESTRLQLEGAGVEATLQTFSALKREGVDDAHEVLDTWLFPDTSVSGDAPSESDVADAKGG